MLLILGRLATRSVICTRFRPIGPVYTFNSRFNSTNSNKPETQPSEKPKPETSSSEKAKTEPPSFKANRPSSDAGPITWKSLFVGGGTLALLTGWFIYLKKLKQDKIEREKTRTYGKAAIGGSFELVDTTGKLRKSDEFLGKWLLIYFGFTHCPDVCPEELEKLAKVVENLSKSKIDIIPLFISVDPERDTPEMVGKYLKEFSDKFIGLTGSKEQIEKATRSYRVYYSVGPKDEENDYIVDHTIISYLIGPTGEMVDYFGQTKAADEVESTIMFHILKSKKK